MELFDQFELYKESKMTIYSPIDQWGYVCANKLLQT